MKILSSEQLESKWVEHWRTRPKAKDIEAHYIQFWDSVGGRDLYFDQASSKFSIPTPLEANEVKLVDEYGIELPKAKPMRNGDKAIFRYPIEFSHYTQRFFLGDDYRIVHLAEDRDNHSYVDMWVEVDWESTKDRESKPATYFYVFQTGDQIRGELEYVGTVPKSDGHTWHIYRQPHL